MRRLERGRLLPALLGWVLLIAIGCSEKPEEGSGRPGGAGNEASSADRGKGEGGGRGGRPGGRRGGPPGFGAPGGEGPTRGVPVEVAAVGRGDISLFFETHGTLEAENEVDLVSRVTGPVVELKAEEGERIAKGRLLARIDDREITTQIGVARARLEEAQQSFDRIRSLFDKDLVARDAYDQALATFESAKGDLERLEVQLAYTRITAPFSGLVVQRYVRFAEHVQAGARLFRLSDFDPLLCPVQVPERELSRLKLGQRAELTVESFPGRRFQAEVLRISPVVDSATGTVKVTLEVAAGEDLLRPGMFAAVYLEMENRKNTLVVPKSALALDSLGNTVYVAADGVAQRRDLELGFRNDELLEVISGIEEGEKVVTLGQDGLSDGTPVEILGGPGAEVSGESNDGPSPPARKRGGGPFRNLDLDDPDQVAKARARMRERGLSDGEIDERLERIRARREEGGGRP